MTAVGAAVALLLTTSADDPWAWTTMAALLLGIWIAWWGSSRAKADKREHHEAETKGAGALADAHAEIRELEAVCEHTNLTW